MKTIFLPIVPSKSTSQTAGKRMMIRNGKPVFFKNKKAAAAEQDLLALLSAYAPEKPMEGPVRLWVTFSWPWRKSEPKKNRAKGWKSMTTKPDCSNVIKLLEDCMTKLGFWHDDAQIARLTVEKRWADKVGISITFEEIEG